MKNKADKIKFIRFQAFKQDSITGTVYAYAIYDVHKVRHMEYFKLSKLIVEKTSRIYPFAMVVDKGIGWADAYCNTAQIMIAIPLSPNIRATIIGDGDYEKR